MQRVQLSIGGTSGIGLTLAKGLAAAGANVVPSGRRRELVESVATEIRKAGLGSLALTCDVADSSILQAVLAAVRAEFGNVDILVNCAMTQRTSTLEMSGSDWNAILETNLNGTLRACEVFGRHMIERQYGRIINIASISSTLGMHEVAAYAASKAGVAALTKSLAVEWARSGVCVNALVPGVSFMSFPRHECFLELELILIDLRVLILDSRVEAGSRSLAAAALGPETQPLDSLNAASMISCSLWNSFFGGRDGRIRTSPFRSRRRYFDEQYV